eukprot:6799157-Prymnesium_polylepis.1
MEALRVRVEVDPRLVVPVLAVRRHGILGSATHGQAGHLHLVNVEGLVGGCRGQYAGDLHDLDG